MNSVTICHHNCPPGLQKGGKFSRFPEHSPGEERKTEREREERERERERGKREERKEREG